VPSRVPTASSSVAFEWRRECQPMFGNLQLLANRIKLTIPEILATKRRSPDPVPSRPHSDPVVISGQ
jgi:hypothetical protein